MAPIVYSLCCLASIACAVALLVSYRRSRARILLWTGICFVGLALNNVLLVVDFLIVPDVDLYFIRNFPVLAGLAFLIYGMIWDTV